MTLPISAGFARTQVVLQVLPALETGGVERGTVEMVQAIVGAGGTAIVASAGGRMVSEVERAGGRHVGLKLLTKDPLSIWLNAAPLARLIRREGVTLVHARSRAPAWSALWAARRTKVPFVTTWHGVYGEDFPGKRLYNGVMARGDRVIAISHFVASSLQARHRVDAERLRVIYRGVDAAVFDPALAVGDRVHRLAQAWRLPPGAPVVMLPARLTRWKGAELLLDAMALLPVKDAYCVFVGSHQGRQKYAHALATRAERLGLTGRVRFAGQCDDMPAALMLADVVVSASLKPEPFGRVVIEAQAMGRPVVVSDHGGAAETVQPGVTGWRVPPGDPAALAAAIGHALSLDEQEKADLAHRCRDSVLTYFTTAAMQEATLAVYRELLG